MRPITEKQRTAIWNMRYALGNEWPSDNMPETVADASAEIRRLKDLIHNNLSKGGTVNARHSPLVKDCD